MKYTVTAQISLDYIVEAPNEEEARIQVEQVVEMPEGYVTGSLEVLCVSLLDNN
jgi:hypothetical protein